MIFEIVINTSIKAALANNVKMKDFFIIRTSVKL